jgi:tetratricopeptide (TPR) repeat protein
LNDFAGAITDLTQAVQLNPNDSESFYYRGLARSKMNKYSDALNDYNQSIMLNPRNFTAYYGRGVCKSKLGFVKDAIEDYNKAIEINGAAATTKPYYNTFITENTIVLLDGIVQKYTQPSDLSAGRPEVYLSRGIAKNATGDGKDAILDLDRAIEIEPTNADSYFVRAVVKSSLGDQRGALLDCSNAIKLNNKHAEAFFLRGIIKHILVDKNEACFDLSRAGEFGMPIAYSVIQKYCGK